MKFMVIVKATQDSEAGITPSEELMRDMGNFNEALVKAGIMLSGDGLYPSSQGARVRFSGKNRTVVNGPFAETKELVAGFWVWQVKSLEEAIEWVKRCPNPMPGDSEIEIRRIYGPEDFAAVDPTGEFRAQEQRMIEETERYRLDGPRFETGREMIIAGLSRNYTGETREKIPQLWQKFMPFLGEIPGQIGKKTYGVCYGYDADGSFDYMAGVEAKDTARLPSGFTHLRLVAQRYAVFTHTKHVSKLCDTFDAIYTKWLPNSGLEAIHAPSFEKYSEAFNPETGMGGIEVWVPIKA
ncbi:MAG TPA: GyrI-like domain-containing protein [Oligoflexus sp.]|uniref:GyrI-like domain-containing protein n=1 Tax=Oligoflexus sp. TaxID=1971216 RepID=UPI002D227E54|nr:GyrI-like domain-containing protein [Oligoflexus sp.]HYX34609.1 GyrI-like domain-containing protein [Oligoflexus sp.]